VNTKTPIVKYFKAHWPDYVFVEEKRPILIFRRPPQNGIFQILALQRDSTSCALSLNIGCTYDSAWRGAPGSPLGIYAGLADLRLGCNAPIIEHWHDYKPDLEGLLETLDDIKRQFDQFAPEFINASRARLLSDPLVQLGLSQLTNFSEEELFGLMEPNKSGSKLLGDNTHPAFVRLKTTLEAAWTPEIPEERRQWTNRIAFDCLALRQRQFGK